MRTSPVRSRRSGRISAASGGPAGMAGGSVPPAVATPWARPPMSRTGHVRRDHADGIGGSVMRAPEHRPTAGPDLQPVRQRHRSCGASDTRTIGRRARRPATTTCIGTPARAAERAVADHRDWMPHGSPFAHDRSWRLNGGNRSCRVGTTRDGPLCRARRRLQRPGRPSCACGRPGARPGAKPLPVRARLRRRRQRRLRAGERAAPRGRGSVRLQRRHQPGARAGRGVDHGQPGNLWRAGQRLL